MRWREYIVSWRFAVVVLAALIAGWFVNCVAGPRSPHSFGPLRGADGATEVDALRRLARDPIQLHLIPRIWERRAPPGFPR